MNRVRADPSLCLARRRYCKNLTVIWVEKSIHQKLCWRHLPNPTNGTETRIRIRMRLHVLGCYAVLHRYRKEEP